MMRSRVRATASLLIILIAVGGWFAEPVSATSALVTMAISQSPAIVPDGAPVTYTGTVTRKSGTPTNVSFGMQATNGNFSGGDCEPASHCAGGFDPSWTYATLSSKVTVTFTTTARIGRKVTFFLLGGNAGCSGTCPPSVTSRGPTITTAASWTSDGQVVAGATLHVSVRAATNAGPIQGDLHVGLPSGVDPPTNLPDGASYAPSPYHYIDNVVDLANAASYSFDVVVTAPSPTTLSFAIDFFPTNSANGNAESILAVKVGPDSTAPTTTGPTQSLGGGTALSGGLVPVRFAWTGTDAGSGVEHYELALSTDGHPSVKVDSVISAPVTYRYLAASHTYRVWVRGVDHAGNIGPWVPGLSFKLTAESEATSAIRYGGTWSVSSSSLYRGGRARSTGTAGRTATRAFTGRSIAWLALKGPTKGKAVIYVDGVLSATVDLFASTNQGQRLVWAKTWTTSKSHKVMIKVLGTSGRPTVTSTV